jgi:hypothetical protein
MVFPANQHAVYFRSVPGKRYGVGWADSPSGPWNTVDVINATAAQKRLVFEKPATQAFYRVLLAQWKHLEWRGKTSVAKPIHRARP